LFLNNVPMGHSAYELISSKISLNPTVGCFSQM